MGGAPHVHIGAHDAAARITFSGSTRWPTPGAMTPLRWIVNNVGPGIDERGRKRI